MKKRFIAIIMALLTVCWIALADEGKVLKLGDIGNDVLELNTRLRQLNYTLSRAGNEYTKSTVTAVSAVQEAYQLPVTGEADKKTLSVIYGDCYRPLSYGDSGEDVRLLQEKLIELGFYWGNVSGNYLEGSTAAIQTFQKENGLEITGKADVKTQEKLFAMLVRPTPTPTPVPTPSPVPTPTPTPGPYREYKSELKYGSTGNNVQLVQQRLMDLGYFTYYKTTTGYYKNTQAAVEAFQKNNGLKVTGTVNKETWNLLFNDPSVVDVNSTPHPTRVPQPPAYFLEVDVNNQVVKVWKYNSETKDYTDFDRAFLCSTGTTSYPTPLGTFTLSGKRSKYCEFPNWGGGQGRWWTDIDGTNAFHSVLYTDSSDLMTLKTSTFTNLGKRASHGCIRLTLADAQWVFDHVEPGMKVWIHESAASDPELKYAVRPGELNKNNMLPKTTPAPTPLPAYNGAVPPAGEIRNLQVGREGEDVYWLQMKLKELGFYTGTVTGQYREGTEKAVKAYQRARGLTVDGKAGRQTLQYLYKEVEKANATPVPTATPLPTPTPTAVPVNSDTPAPF